MKWIACLGAVVFIAIAPAFLTAQEVRRAMVEEVQAVPSGVSKSWTIGGRVFGNMPTTQVVGSDLPAVGDLAIVQFVARDDQLLVTAIQSLGVKVAELNDGPYVLWKDATTAEVLTMIGGQVRRKTYQDIAGPKVLGGFPLPVESIRLDPAVPQSPPAVWEQPDRLMAISDLEGNYQNARKFLENNQIIDPDGNWIWGDGHLVLVGDLVDRGRQVTELMWLIYQLERQAREAGGEVHYILGNHEAMVMGGDLRYIHPKYRFVTDRMKMDYDQLFAEDSEIGRWWRSKNGVETIGNLLFIHGGYSPLLDQEQLTVDALNRKIREGLAPAQPTGVTPGTNPVRHQHGPFWYRGYFERYADSWGGKATAEEIQKILKRHGVEHIVVGHTLVEAVGPLDESGAVIAVDVKWEDVEKCQGLLQEAGQLYRVSIDGTRDKIELGK